MENIIGSLKKEEERIRKQELKCYPIIGEGFNAKILEGVVDLIKVKIKSLEDLTREYAEGLKKELNSIITDDYITKTFLMKYPEISVKEDYTKYYLNGLLKTKFFEAYITAAIALILNKKSSLEISYEISKKLWGAYSQIYLISAKILEDYGYREKIDDARLHLELETKLKKFDEASINIRLEDEELKKEFGERYSQA